MPKLFVISGPSGSGKDAVIDGLEGAGVRAARVITTTSRPMRASESEGKPYHFLSPEEFARQKDAGEFLEFNLYNGIWRGARETDLSEALASGLPVIWRVDPLGVKTLKKIRPEIKTILITADTSEIEKRLQTRGENSAEEIKARLHDCEVVNQNLSDYDFIIQNHDGHLAEAVGELAKIINTSIQ